MPRPSIASKDNVPAPNDQPREQHKCCAAWAKGDRSVTAKEQYKRYGPDKDARAYCGSEADQMFEGVPEHTAPY